ncbi:unnamed protein product [Bursaphelenchus okinawaensis]|uniref:C3H1-type domain-containing protein n=1 Tax=Bursaphelenchus okinawaensis TaxID=465554 RepID=A0A811JVY5_9BILA|nr:unnamed protein product [Bursaphelenchus okinawaensis]CAG9086282.1 unnamed protein product [Bursaphelenchus okinawaensis]
MGIHNMGMCQFAVSEVQNYYLPRYSSQRTSRSTNLSVSSSHSVSSGDSLDQHVGDKRKFHHPRNVYNSSVYKTQFCRAYKESGFCQYGKSCRFAHGDKELRIQEIQLHPKYKTEHCRNFQMKGHCHYGVNCQFIHEESREEIEVSRFHLVSKVSYNRDQDVDSMVELTTQVLQICNMALNTFDIDLRQDPFAGIYWNKNVPREF